MLLAQNLRITLAKVSNGRYVPAYRIKHSKYVNSKEGGTPDAGICIKQTRTAAYADKAFR